MPIKFLSGLFLFFILNHFCLVLAQDALEPKVDTIKEKKKIESVSFTPRKFDEAKLSQLRKESAYIYDRQTLSPNPTFWELLMRWIHNLFRSTMDTPAKRDAWQWGFYIFSAFAVVFVILRLLKVDMAVWFKTESETTNEINFQALSENIHVIDFDKLIKDSIQKNNFRQAVRLYYLKSLKKMSDAKLIEWEKNKTNRDYYYELKPAYRNGFQNITWWFEYVCYGEFNLDNTGFKQASESFMRYEEEITKKH
jgi:hypothetical protein